MPCDELNGELEQGTVTTNWVELSIGDLFSPNIISLIRDFNNTCKDLA